MLNLRQFWKKFDALFHEFSAASGVEFESGRLTVRVVGDSVDITGELGKLTINGKTVRFVGVQDQGVNR